MTGETASSFDVAREALHRGYLGALRGGGLVVQVCEDCSASYFPPVVRCGACGGSSHGWVAHRSGRVVASTQAAGAPAETVLVEVPGARILALADPAEDLRPGAAVERVDVASDDRAPRVSLVARPEQGDPVL